MISSVEYAKKKKEEAEKIAYIIAVCTKVRGNLYKTSHNNTAATIGYEICQHYRILTTMNTLLYKHNPTEENKKIKILCDLKIKTD